MAYCTTADVKAYTGITATADDTLIGLLIARAQSMIDNETQRTFEAASDTTRHFDADLDTTDYLLDWTHYGLDLCQITSVTNGDGTVITSNQYVTEPRHATPWYGITLKASTGLWWMPDANADSQNAIAIVGRWAYSITPPDDIKHACIRLATFLYRQKDSGVFDVVMVPGSGEMIVPQGMPKDVAVVLQRYRRLV